MLVTSRAAMLALMITLASCSTAPTYTAEDVAMAVNQGQLEDMFKQVQAELKAAKPGSDKALSLDTTLEYW